METRPTNRARVRAAKLTSWIPAGTMAILLLTMALPAAQAQTFTVLHTFTGNRDGAQPIWGLVMDQGGNLYGTTEYGGTSGDGVVFKMARLHSGWVLNTLWNFVIGTDGQNPRAGVTLASDGELYGTTVFGGDGGCIGGCGVVYRLRPPLTSPPSPQTPWTLTTLHQFQFGNGDGVAPSADVTFDPAGNIFSTTFIGGDEGTVYELQPSGGNWNETILHKFQGGAGDGIQPHSGVIIDAAGNLYGVTPGGGPGDWGVVYELVPYRGGGYTFHILYAFQNNGIDGAEPWGELVMDSAGNLYGTTTVGGQGFGGTVFELSPVNGGWNFQVLYSFPGGEGPLAALTMDAAGNLYGATHEDGEFGYGNVFKMTRSGSGWTYTTLYDFTNGNDGEKPLGRLVLDANGNLYGTAAGGADGNGVLFELAP